MPLEIVTIPCRTDNYAFLLHSDETGETAVIDAPEAPPILAELKRRNWQLSEIWLTHHHYDDVDGTAELKDATGARVVGASADADRLPPLNLALDDEGTFQFAGSDVRVIDVSGHTVGHIAFYVADVPALFSGDSLMALGCGRLFEGTPAQMWNSLSKMAALPGDTIVCSGHEYSASNAKFAATIEKDNARLAARIQAITDARAADQATVPTLLSEEIATNPFLRAHLPELKTAVGMEDAADSVVFGEIRARKDAF